MQTTVFHHCCLHWIVCSIEHVLRVSTLCSLSFSCEDTVCASATETILRTVLCVPTPRLPVCSCTLCVPHVYLVCTLCVPRVYFVFTLYFPLCAAESITAQLSNSSGRLKLQTGGLETHLTSSVAVANPPTHPAAASPAYRQAARPLSSNPIGVSLQLNV